MSRSTAAVDLGAIVGNLRRIGEVVGVPICAVVKANGYGHGAAATASAAIAGGATMLAVAHVDEASDLRRAGLGSEILVLSEPAVDEVEAVVALRLQQVVFRPEMIARLGEVATAEAPARLHLKVDTGMRRVGCDPNDAVALARAIVDHPHLTLAGTMTHCAVADEPDNPTTGHQLDLFDEVLGAMGAAGIDPGVRHAANSAAALLHPRARHDMVRVGIAMYGLTPAIGLEGLPDLQPALSWDSTVSMVKAVPAGDKVSYGHRHTFDRDTVVATVPVGYADGYRRRLGSGGGEVLIGGQRCPIRGVVTMDQLVAEVGPGAAVAVGDPVVLIGSQGRETITADDLATLMDTINYEITCGISARVARSHRMTAQ